MPRIKGMTRATFWDHISPEPMSGCWLWPIGAGRYGTATVDGVYQLACRHVLEWKIGRRLAKGEWCCHKCGTTACVNPDHIYLGNARTNAMDQWHGPERSRRKPTPWVRSDLRIRWERKLRARKHVRLTPEVQP